MNRFLLIQTLLLAFASSAAAGRFRFPANAAEAQAEGKQMANQLLKPTKRAMAVVDAKNAEVEKTDVNRTDRLPVRVPHLFRVVEEPNSTKAEEQKEKEESYEVRMKKAKAHGQAAPEKPTTAWVKTEDAKLKEAWNKYAKPPHSAQPMIAECASILQGTRTEFAQKQCGMEFHDRLELTLKAAPYCAFFDKEFAKSADDLEYQADKWCGKAECETSVEELEGIEMEAMAVANEKPSELLTYVTEAVAKVMPTWKKDGCQAKICTTLHSQASQVSAAYKAYTDLGSAYVNYANVMKLEGLVLYDLYKASGCK